jgi:hypothetical protein
MTRTNMHPDVAFELELGCVDYTDRLGIAKMPAGYRLYLNPDYTHFFWIRESDGAQSSINWDKWAVRREAIADAKRLKI